MVLVGLNQEMRWLVVVLDLFDRSKATKDELKTMTPAKGTARPHRSTVDSKSWRNQHLEPPSREIGLQDLGAPGLVRGARHQK